MHQDQLDPNDQQWNSPSSHSRWKSTRLKPDPCGIRRGIAAALAHLGLQQVSHLRGLFEACIGDDRRALQRSDRGVEVQSCTLRHVCHGCASPREVYGVGGALPCEGIHLPKCRRSRRGPAVLGRRGGGSGWCLEAALVLACVHAVEDLLHHAPDGFHLTFEQVHFARSPFFSLVVVVVALSATGRCGGSRHGRRCRSRHSRRGWRRCSVDLRGLRVGRLPNALSILLQGQSKIVVPLLLALRREDSLDAGALGRRERFLGSRYMGARVDLALGNARGKLLRVELATDRAEVDRLQSTV
mmetsp:Transcript_17914/g.62876  ORF Transcript_17914/g.62876 Transcript_17914/m.62876 type:complete len:299 (-) Transcript_17914:1328-2224(-)